MRWWTRTVSRLPTADAGLCGRLLHLAADGEREPPHGLPAGQPCQVGTCHAEGAPGGRLPHDAPYRGLGRRERGGDRDAAYPGPENRAARSGSAARNACRERACPGARTCDARDTRGACRSGIATRSGCRSRSTARPGRRNLIASPCGRIYFTMRCCCPRWVWSGA